MAVMIAVGVCFVFTLLYFATGRKRNDGLTFRAMTNHSYYVNFPVAHIENQKHGHVNECGEGSDDESSSSADVAFLAQKHAAANDHHVPIARRTVPPVVGVRRAPVLQAQAQAFYMVDSSPATSNGPAV
jgi:hypothetical protein